MQEPTIERVLEIIDGRINRLDIKIDAMEKKGRGDSVGMHRADAGIQELLNLKIRIEEESKIKA